MNVIQSSKAYRGDLRVEVISSREKPFDGLNCQCQIGEPTKRSRRRRRWIQRPRTGLEVPNLVEQMSQERDPSRQICAVLLERAAEPGLGQLRHVANEAQGVAGDGRRVSTGHYRWRRRWWLTCFVALYVPLIEFQDGAELLSFMRSGVNEWENWINIIGGMVDVLY